MGRSEGASPTAGRARLMAGLAAQKAGELDAATAHYEAVLRQEPENPDALHLLGLLMNERGQREQAEALIRRAIAANGTVAGYHNNLGNVLARLGRDAEALAEYRRAIELAPRDASAHNNLGNVLRAQGKLVEAESAQRRAVELDPGHAEAWNNLGIVLNRLGRLAEARAALVRALRLRPRYAQALNNLGNVYRDLRQPDKALECFNRALEISPGDAAALNNLGIVLQAVGKAGRAIDAYRRALKSNPHYPQALNNLGTALAADDRPQEAIACYRRALELRPEYPQALSNLGTEIWAQGDVAAGVDYVRRAIALDANCEMAHFNYAVAQLLTGDYAAGWDRYEWRWRCPEFRDAKPMLPYPEWDGTDLAGRALLVTAEQGLGDEIMFSSLIPEVAARAGRVVLECSAKLAKLFGRSFGGVRLLEVDRTKEGWQQRLGALLPGAGRIDVQCALGSLPRFLRRSLEAFPEHRGYLQADPARVAYWRSRLAELGTGPKVGLSWRGGVPRTGRRRRSLDLTQCSGLLAAPGVRFVSLQYGDCREEIDAFERASGLVLPHWREAIDDYDETAALVTALDAVVSVCTAVVHLAGALGRPVWVLAPAVPEWRYGLAGEHMPWYPTARVLRQRTPGDWSVPLGRARELLQGRATGGTAPALPADWPGALARLKTALAAAGTSWPAPAVAQEIARAQRLYERGELPEAERILRAVCTADPGCASACTGLAAVLNRSRRYMEALGWCDRAIAVMPELPEAHFNRGNALKDLRRYAEAATAYERALSLRPAYAKALNNLGLVLKRLGRLQDGEEVLRRAVEGLPPGAALAMWDRALRAAPRVPEVHYNRGNALKDLGRFEEAAAAYRRALDLKPGYFKALNNLGIVLMKDEATLAEAVAALKRALEIEPAAAHAHSNLGEALRLRGRLEEAAAAFRRSIELKPDFAEGHWNLGALLLMTGSFASGWEHYEWRWRLPEMQSYDRGFRLPSWDGGDLAGRTVLLTAEQGLGDEIMFSSLVPELQRRSGRCLLECSLKLARLFARSFPSLQLLVVDRDQPAWEKRLARLLMDSPRVDVQIPLGSAPRFLRRSLGSFPRHRGYLKADPARVEYWRARLAALGPGPKVGVSWRGGVPRTGQRRRSLDLVRLAPLFAVPGVRFVSLQYTDCRAEIEACRQATGYTLPHWQEAIDDYDETAALVCALDLVVSVCTAVVHLSGALGRPTCVMAPAVPEWRYGSTGGRMPWYPSVRILRQRETGAWDDVVRDAAALVARGGRRRT